MVKDILKLVAGKTREQATIDEFFRLAEKITDKFELRTLEQSLLKPKPIAKYKGQDQGRTNFKMKSLMITFPNKKVIGRWAKFIRVNQYKENNTWDSELFMCFLEALEKGRLKYKDKKLKFVTRNGREISL